MRAKTQAILMGTAALAVLGALPALASPAPAGVPKQPAECCAATGADVPKVGGDFGDQDYSSLAGITTANVGKLAGAWRDHLENGAATQPQEATPVAVGGILYLQTGQGDVFAVNGATGKVVWEYKSGFAGTERGVAVAGGRVFAALGGEHVVALSQQTGTLIWRVQVGTKGQDTTANGAGTPWTLYYNGLVLVGTQNGGGAGMRGHLYALRASTGAVAWNFAGTAGPGQPGHNSWKGSSWELGGGDVWMAPAVDPQLGLIYLAVANPEPRVDGAGRAGNDLYTNSLVALHASTGKLDWYFQSVHHDLWDYDNTMSPVIADVRYAAGVRKVVIYGSKTGWLYYLNAKTGRAVIGVHEKKVPQLASQATSATQPVPQGDSLVPTCPSSRNSTRAIPDYTSGCEFTPYLNKPVLVAPGGAGGANWALMSFDQRTGLLYVAASEIDTAYSNGLPYGQPTFWRPAGGLSSGVLDAVDPRTNTIAWHQPTTYGLSDGDGILSTAGGLLFEGTTDGLLTARSASTGKVVWSWQAGTGIADAPITYTAGGQQYVAVLAGGDRVPYREPHGDSLWAFRIGGTLSQASPPPAIPTRLPVDAPAVAGSAAHDTVVLGRVWDAATGAPGPTEQLGSEVAMAPAVMTVPAGTTVTFTNPSGNAKDHCAESFFDPASFKIGPLAPGHSGTVTFTKAGTYFYNDCAGFPWNTGEIIVG
ncbi:MAG TPA: PQQ-binding-like beta-propeller repeat protein [Streptosporangiaceae bacterium]|nr:PQQ-binding-like beta-propeller repeat protein [Streptosporangiaceae bacterium]